MRAHLTPVARLGRAEAALTKACGWVGWGPRVELWDGVRAHWHRLPNLDWGAWLLLASTVPRPTIRLRTRHLHLAWKVIGWAELAM